MDRWLNNLNVVRVVALVLGVLLWVVVQVDRQPPSSSNVPSTTRDEERLISDVQVIPEGHDEESLIVREMDPAFVNIVIRGKASDINRVSPRDRETRVVASLHGLGGGEHEVTLRAEGFPEDVQVTIYSPTARVVLEEIQFKEVPIEIQVIGEPESGFRVGTPISQPSRALVSLPERMMDQVDFVRATIDISGASSTQFVEAELTAIDRSGSAVEEAIIQPNIADIEVPVTPPFKTVPLQIRWMGDPPQGTSIASLRPNLSEVTLYGSEAILAEIEFYRGVTVDLSEVTESGTYTYAMPLPEGIVDISPEEVEIEIEVTQSEQRTFEGIPIRMNGISEDLQAVLLSPESGQVNVTIEGAANLLANITAEDIQAVVDVNNLPLGEHEIPIHWNLPLYVNLAGEQTVYAVVDIQEGTENPDSPPEPEPDPEPEPTPPEEEEDEATGTDPGPVDDPNENPGTPDDTGNDASEEPPGDLPENPPANPSNDAVSAIMEPRGRNAERGKNIV